MDIAADSVLILHAIYVGIVVLSVPLIIVGGLRRWRWVRQPWFRLTHLAMILFVALESVIGMACPLTLWERALRHADIQDGAPRDFIATLLDGILFYRLPHWVFTAAYAGFALLVAALFIIVPPRRSAPPRIGHRR